MSARVGSEGEEATGRVTTIETLGREIRHAARGMVRNPGFTLIVLVTLALGIGATTAIFTMLDRIVLRPLPYAQADRLAACRAIPNGMRISTAVWP